MPGAHGGRRRDASLGGDRGRLCPGGRRVNWTGLPYPSGLVSGREVCRRHFLEELYVFGSQNSVLYRADLVRSRDPFYNEANIHPDTKVCFALLALTGVSYAAPVE